MPTLVKSVLIPLIVLLLSSSAAAERWRPAGPEGGRVTALAADPAHPMTLYAAAEEGGVFKTTDSGAFWSPAIEGLNGASVFTLAHDPNVTGTLYAGTSRGVFKSVDGGEHWTAVNEGLPVDFSRVNALVVSPYGIYANFVTPVQSPVELGLFVSRDDGESWDRLQPTSGNPLVTVLAADPVEPRNVYAGTKGAGVLRSADGGATWTRSGFGLTTQRAVRALAIAPSSRQTLYAALEKAGVLKSTDGGATWRRANRGLADIDIVSLAVHPASPGTVYAGGTQGPQNGVVFRTTDGGAFWQRQAPLLPLREVRALLIDAAHPRVLYAGTYIGGIFKSANAGAKWDAINNGLRAVPSGNVLADSRRLGILYAHTDFGLAKTMNGGVSWSLTGAELRASNPLAIDPQRTATVYAQGAQGLIRSRDGGRRWTRIIINPPPPAMSIPFNLAIDPNEPSRLYAGGFNRFYSSADAGSTWNQIPFLCETPSFLAVTASSELFVGMSSICGPNQIGIGLYKFVEGRFQFFGVGLPAIHPSARGMAADLREPSTVYAGVRGYTGSPVEFVFGVYRTRNGEPWTRLPGLGDGRERQTAFAFPPDEPATIYAALSGLGVFVSRDDGENWTAINAGLPSYAVSALAVDAGSNVYAATMGGIYQLVP